MKLTAKAIAELLDGSVEGNKEVIITHPGKIETADKGAITFLANTKYEIYIYTTKASAVLVSNGFSPSQEISTTLIRVKDVYGAITKLLKFYEHSKPSDNRISSLAFIHGTAAIGKNTAIGDFTSINADVAIGENAQIYPQVFIGENVNIGKNAIIYPGVKIYHHCQIGENCIIHANAVIGADGFGFAPPI